jgi:aryl-alcohol dehydrogenase-like predicted oxidoreductase
MTDVATTGTARVRLGHSDIVMRPIGLGCMGMSQSYGEADEAESIDTIRAAIDLGVGMLDTSDIYGAAAAMLGLPIQGFGHNERLIGKAIAGHRDDVVVATKFGATVPDSQGRNRDGSPQYVRRACEASLSRLGVDHIDLYYYHRLDPAVPIEDTVGAMAGLVAQGKVRAIGLSEVSADLLRRASAVHPISALQSEYSLWERGVEVEVIPACRELGITLVPYSPLGRAILTGQIAAGTTFAATDFRATIPKFNGGNLDHNLGLVESLGAFSERKGFAVGQVALAWLLAQPLDVVPIPGTKRVAYLRQNLQATLVPLSADEVAELGALFDPGKIRGERYGTVGR